MQASEASPGYFGSDNMTPVHQAVMDAVLRANTGAAFAYGADHCTADAKRLISELFETECEIHFVATGTAANSLALSALAPPYGAIFCHPQAHIVNDENTAPELYTGGARLVTVAGADGKPDIDHIRQRVNEVTHVGIHGLKPAALSLTNATEAGTVYTPDELREYAQLCAELDLKLHVDGARFANAVASLGASAADLSWKAGVDVLCFGATKNGAMAAEAVIFFDPALAADFEYRRKRGAQLWSKHRYLAAQFTGYLQDDLWLQLAAHANAMAQRLAKGLTDIAGIRIPSPVQANEVFPILPETVIRGLERDGFVFYPWPVESGMIRLVTTYTTTIDEVDALLTRARVHAGV